ncbi:hypothetical protein PFISCL1PPCAC_25293, partial [Pristionchus fissidentatus]
SEFKRPLVIMIGDDFEWQTATAKQLTNIDVMVLPRSKWIKSPTVDWQFSEIYCDTVLLTASASTFGWWLAYL